MSTTCSEGSAARSRGALKYINKSIVYSAVCFCNLANAYIFGGLALQIKWKSRQSFFFFFGSHGVGIEHEFLLLCVSLLGEFTFLTQSEGKSHL